MKNRENFHQVKHLIETGDYDAFTISETWLNSTVHDCEKSIEGYRLLRMDRNKRSGGAVCAYVRNSLKVKVLRDLSGTSPEGFQQLWLNLQHKRLKSLLICVAYKPRTSL